MALLAFDLVQEVFERGFIGGVAGQDFAGRREAFRGDDQREDPLDAAGPLVAAATQTALVVFILGRDALEAGAGQSGEQRVELRAEPSAPTLLPMGKERRFVFQPLSQRAVERVLFPQRKIVPGQISMIP